MRPSYGRVMIKLSGEAIGEQGKVISPELIQHISSEIADVASKGVSIGLVIGAGNIFRGQEIMENLKVERVVADQVGMLATMINALLFKEVLSLKNVKTSILSALDVPQLAEVYTPQKAWEYMVNGTCVIFAGGTGNPFFTTDTAAALRACEVKAEILIKATKVDGVYDEDPNMDPEAKKFDKLTYLDVINKGLKVMDATAISLCRENNIPIMVYNMYKKGNLAAAVFSKNVGTLIQ